MRIRYSGSQTDGVIVPHEGNVYDFAHGETVEVPDELGAQLADQDGFDEPRQPKPRQPKQKKTAAARAAAETPDPLTPPEKES